jgi:hypothetical protein
MSSAVQSKSDVANAEIANDTASLKSLAVFGNSSSGNGRQVSVYDDLTVSRNATINGTSLTSGLATFNSGIKVKGKVTATDTADVAGINLPGTNNNISVDGNGNVLLTSNGKVWNFGTNGQLSTPGNVNASNINNNPNIFTQTAIGPNTQGAYMSWNNEGGSGKTYFLNQKGLGPGGFKFYNYNGDNTLRTSEMETDGDGNLNVKGTVTASALKMNNAGKLQYYTGNNGTISGNEFCQGIWGNPDGTAKKMACITAKNEATNAPYGCEYVPGAGSSWGAYCIG